MFRPATTRTIAASLVTAALFSCSSGLDSETPRSSVPVPPASGNIATGLFWGFDLVSPSGDRASIEEHAVLSAIIQGGSNAPDRQVAFYAFTTDAAADNAAGTGTSAFLDRTGAPDANGVEDVFIAAVVEEDVDISAFSFSLAGKFRHPRCVNCHSLSAEPGFTSGPPSTVFQESTHPTVEGVAAPQPGSGAFQNTNEGSCLTCHESVLDTLTVEGSALGSGWRNPSREIDGDFRLMTTAQLAERARRSPEDHFSNDRRLAWAFESAMLPSRSTINGPFTAADDDQDGTVEPFDSDGRRRPAPGGLTAFLAEIDAFERGTNATDTRAAIADVRAVSLTPLGSTGNAAAFEPALAYVPTPNFPAGGSGVVGTLYVVFTSSATDLSALATSGLRQVYRARIDVVVGSSGQIDLDHQGVELVSTNAAGTSEGDGPSGAPTISTLGDSAGERIAFISNASDLGAPGGVGRIFVRDLAAGEIALVSSNLDSCTEPSIDPTGRVVAFTTADTLTVPPPGVSDTNGVADVYFTRLSANGPLAAESNFPQRASQTNGDAAESDSGASGRPSVTLLGEDAILVAFESASALDARGGFEGTPAGTPTNVFVHSFTGLPTAAVRGTFQASLSRATDGSKALPNGSSRRPSFPGRADRLVFETDADNLETRFLMEPDPAFNTFSSKSSDENSGADLVSVPLGGILDGSASGRVVGISVSSPGIYGDKETYLPATGPVIPAELRGGFVVAGLTLARNLGASDNHIGLNESEHTPWLSFVADSPAAPRSLFEQTTRFLRSRCLVCHNGIGSPPFPLNLSGDDDAIFASLTGPSAERDCGGGTTSPYVVAGDSGNSLLYEVLLGPVDDCGPGLMPQGSTSPLPASETDVVKDWIDAGAQRRD